MSDSNLEHSAELLLNFKNSLKKYAGDSQQDSKSTRSKKRLFRLDTDAEVKLCVETDEADESSTATSDAGSEKPLAQLTRRIPSLELQNLYAVPPSVINRNETLAAQVPSNLRDSLKRLKNLLKLPKARRWVCCEFFYSDVDRQLFLSDNEFRLCLREALPAMKTRQLCRTEWRRIRRLIGKPRRCSQSLFDEERRILEQKRQKVREMYKGTALSVPPDMDLPTKLPNSFVVGAKVAARVRYPKEGVFVGVVDAVVDGGKYRVIFDKEVVAPLFVDDCDLMSVDQLTNELLAVSFFLEKNKAAQPLTFRFGAPCSFGSSARAVSGLPPTTLSGSVGGGGVAGVVAPLSNISENSSVGGSSLMVENDPLLPRPCSVTLASVAAPPPLLTAAQSADAEEKCGDYPLGCVLSVLEMSKLIDSKRALICKLQHMNAEAERANLYTASSSSSTSRYLRQFQQQYAKLVGELTSVNRRLEVRRAEVERFGDTVASSLKWSSSLAPPHRSSSADKNDVVAECDERARRMLDKCCADGPRLHGADTLDLIRSLTAILLHLRSIGQQLQQQRHRHLPLSAAYEFRCLYDRLNELKGRLGPENRRDFEDNVEVHVKHIEVTMTDASFLYDSSPTNE